MGCDMFGATLRDMKTWELCVRSAPDLRAFALRSDGSR